ncbi:hypothetical protein ACHAXA_002847 [Cyclostephanos tholiformis]|uniref:LITAF domain-containing protein n=1 Tax=Cyclostephanos tholiformis TaxID=382380 RepID=A0ABD3RBK5_9STRA
MGLFTKSADKDFDVAATREPPLVTATPVVYESLPTPAEAKINHANARTNKHDDILPSLTRHPTSIQQCPHCGATNVMTSTRTYPGPETYVMCLILMLVFWPVCWMPLVMDAAKRTDHMCKRCGGVVGHVKALSDCCIEERG